jgi:hypothetical protein
MTNTARDIAVAISNAAKQVREKADGLPHGNPQAVSLVAESVGLWRAAHIAMDFAEKHLAHQITPSDAPQAHNEGEQGQRLGRGLK